MSAVFDFIEDLVEGIGDAVGDLIDGIGDVLEDINDNIIKPAIKIVKTTIENALDDPIGTIAKIATAIYAPHLLPVVNGAVTLANGGSMEDAFKSAALTYVGQEVFSNLEFGSEILEDGTTQAITLKSLSSDLGNWVAENTAALGEGISNVLSNTAVQGTLGAVKGGLTAALQGKDIGEGIAGGLTSGALSGGLNTTFSEIADELDIDLKNSTTAMAGKTILALAQGKDPNELLAGYLAYTVNSAGAKALGKLTNDAFTAFKEFSADFSGREAEFNADLTSYKTVRQELVEDSQEWQAEVEQKWTPIQTKLDQIVADQNGIKNNFDAQKAIYDDTSRSVEERNAAADKMTSLAADYNAKNTEYTTLYDANKGTYEALEDKRDAITSSINTLDNTVGKDLATTRTELERDVTTLADYKARYDNATSTYEAAVAEATTKNVLIDSVNTGAIKGELQDDGSILLSNGMTIKDGQFLQDGKNAFANADPIEQGQLRFTSDDGKQVWYDNDRTRQLSTTDAQDMLFKDYGIKADVTDVLGVVGQKYDALDPESLQNVAANKVNDEYNSLLGRDATQEEIDAAFTPGQDALRNVAGQLSAEILPTDQFFGSEDDKVAFAKQLAAVRADKGAGAEFTWKNPYTGEVETHQAFTAYDIGDVEDGGQIPFDENAFTSQWQTVGDQRVFIHDDGTATVINPKTGENGYLTEDEVFEWTQQGLLNVPTIEITADRPERDYDFPEESDGPQRPPEYTINDMGEVVITADRPERDSDSRLGSVSSVLTDLSKPKVTSNRFTGMSSTTKGVLPGTPGSGMPGVQPGAQKGVLPTGNPLEQDYLNIGLSKDKFIDPLSQLYQIQQATQQGGDGNLAQMMFQQFNPSAMQATQPTQASGTGDSYYNYGQAEDQPYTGAASPFSPNPYSPSPYAQGFESATLGMATGGAIMATPLMAQGGKTLPLHVNGVLPTVSEGRENFKQGKHVAGEGDGQSDDIPAWLADGEFVFPADVVSALGNGSTKAGTDKLYEMMHNIREHARSTGKKDLPPPAKKSPLDYLKA
jgi:hypothetical protein